MSKHIRRTLNNQNNAHYLGKNIQNEIIYLISNCMKSKILEMIKEAKHYSIILDCTPDVSYTEQMTLIVRFVLIDLKNEESIVKIHEHFLGFIPVESSTGMSLSDILIQRLRDLDIPIQNM